MQFQVPQFIETEDKIIGPFSIKQFVLVSAGAAVSFLLYFTVQTWLWAVLSVVILGGAVAFALVKIGGRPLTRVALSAARFYWEPQTYVWKQKTAAPKGKKEEIKTGGIENVVSGLALRGAWQRLQTGSKTSPSEFVEKHGREKLQIFRKMTGDRDVARRVDYR